MEIFGLKADGFVYGENELQVGGYNSENAEPGNPEGAWYKRVHIAAICLNRGEIYHHCFSFDEDQEEVFARFLDKVNDHLDAGGELNKDHWRFHRLAYGSEAYLKQGGEDELMRLEELEEGRNWF